MRKALREQAERCRRLARSIYDPRTSDELERYAKHLDEQAVKQEELERAALQGD